MKSSMGILLLWMMALAVGSVSSTFMVFESIKDCPSHLNRDKYLKYNDNRCYFFHKSLKSYKDAEKICKNEGGQLTTSKSLTSQSFLFRESRQAFGYAGVAWIGLNDMERENQYVWSDGTKLGLFDYQNFGDNEGIQGQKTAEKCVAHDLLYGFWKEYSCDDQKPFVCEFVPVDPQPPTISLEQCPYHLNRDRYLTVFGNSCYRYVYSSLLLRDFWNAKEFCDLDGGYLVTTTSHGENSFISHWLKTQFLFEWKLHEGQMWIGLWTNNRVNKFIWNNGTKMGDYENFKDTQGVHAVINLKVFKHRCTILDLKTSQWVDSDCSVERPYVCEYKPKSPKTG